MRGQADWFVDAMQGAYGMSAQLEDGSTLTFKRRERPKVRAVHRSSLQYYKCTTAVVTGNPHTRGSQHLTRRPDV